MAEAAFDGSLEPWPIAWLELRQGARIIRKANKRDTPGIGAFRAAGDVHKSLRKD